MHHHAILTSNTQLYQQGLAHSTVCGMRQLTDDFITNTATYLVAYL